MKILLVCFWNMPIMGGVGTYMANLKKGLEKLGHHVDVFGQQKGVCSSYLLNGKPILPKYKIRNGITKKIYHFYDKYAPTIPLKMKILESERYGFELAATLVDLGKYDVIHCQDVISTRIISRVNAQQRPLVATIHGCLTYELLHAGVLSKRQTPLRQYYVVLERLGIAAADTVIVPTSWLHRLLSENFVTMKYSCIVPYGIDRDRFMSQMNAPTQLASFPRLTLICPARLDPIKGHTVLFEALAKLKQQRSDWVCLLLGDGAIRQKLETLCRQLRLENHVLFLGNRHDVPALMKKADIVVLPSLQDNQPFAVMEAQLAGKPVVVSNAGGIPEMVHHGRTGLVSDVYRSEPLYQNLMKLVDDPSLRGRLGQQSKNWAWQQWSLEKMVHRTIAIYKQL